MNITIKLDIKFRAFLRDWFRLERQFVISRESKLISVLETDPSPVPTTARKLADVRGVRLFVW